MEQVKLPTEGCIFMTDEEASETSPDNEESEVEPVSNPKEFYSNNAEMGENIPCVTVVP